MSMDLMTLAWRTELQSGARLVMLAICDNAGDDGTCYPSMSTLSLKCGLSLRAARAHVSALADDKLLLRNERDGRSTEYHVNLPELRLAVYRSLSKRKALSEFDKGILKACTPEDKSEEPPRQNLPTQQTPAGFADLPGNICRPPRQDLPTTPAESAAITINEPSPNLHLKKKGKKAASAPSAFVLPDWINQTHWDVWHSTAKRKKATDAQKQLAVETLRGWRDQGLDYAKALQDAAVGGWQGLFEPRAQSVAAIRPAARSFAEQDRDAGMRRWEEMTGRTHPERAMQGGPVIDITPRNLQIGGGA